MEIESQNLNDAPPARLVAGALAHLARHMTTGCPRAAELASLLLARVAEDADADPHLRAHAHELVDILEREQILRASPPSRFADTAERLAGGWPA
ncbi:MAG: hypothetical protein IT500_05615 [Rubrivivax sp.]|jgi:broad specificity phosphatase PhoE|nr:hypothetical protein [Rubrivivax sp.]